MYKNYSFMQEYKCLLIPDWLGSARKNGVELGPACLNQAILSSDKKINNKLLIDYFSRDSIAVQVPDSPQLNHTQGLYEKNKYLPEIKEVCNSAKKGILKIIDGKKHPIVLMGDDSSLIGVLSGISERHTNNFGLVYFDAHGDINTPQTTLSGCIFGMPLSYLLNIDNLSKFFNNKNYLHGENITMMGARNFDEGEKEFINKLKFCFYSPDKINETDSEKLCGEILSYYSKKNIDKLFMHIDVDVLDPSESKGTLLCEPNGIKAEKIYEIISILAKSSVNLGISISEYNPILDENNSTLSIAVNILHKYIENSCYNQ